MPLQIGDLAPHIPNLNYSPGWTLIYFYPADFTPGCTKEACSFRDNFAELSKKVKIIGISADSEDSHQKFKAEYKLPFDLLSDPSHEITKSFGADGFLFPKRVSFLINSEGKIEKIYPKVNVSAHAQEILHDLT